MNFRNWAWLLFGALAACSGLASAQSIGWRFQTYGEQPSIDGIPRQALAFDGRGGLFEVVETTDSVAQGGHLKRIDVATGVLLWQAAVPATLNPPIALDPKRMLALTAVGTDAALATTVFDTSYRAAVARYRGTDGALLWRALDPQARAAYDAVASDAGGAIIAGGAGFSAAQARWLGRVAKFDGSGALLWAVDVDPIAACGSGNTDFAISGVRVDASGDVVVAGAPRGDAAVGLCALKLRGDTGGVVWTANFPLPANTQAISAQLALDANGNPAAVVGFQSGMVLLRFDGAAGTRTWMQPLAYATIDFTFDGAGNVVVSADTTQSYAAADGQARWATAATQTGSLALSADGSILIGSDFASQSGLASGRHFTYSALDPASGALRWSTDLDIDTLESWDFAAPALAIDGAGHFAALQAESAVCCTQRSLLALGRTTDGALAWSDSDPDLGPGAAQVHRGAATTPDGGIVTAGVTFARNGLPGDPSSRLLTLKRAQRDGHLLWSQQSPLGDFCVSGGVAIDGNGDVIAIGGCSDGPVVFKYRGSDGWLLWQATPNTDCLFSPAEGVVLDADNSIYVAGTCDTSASDQNYLYVTKLGADGSIRWQQTADGNDAAPAAAPWYPGFGLVRAGTQLYVAGNRGFSGEVIVTALRTADGTVAWRDEIAPTGGAVYSLRTLTALPGGDVVASGYGIATRLDAASGSPVWSNTAVPGDDRAALVDAVGDLVLVGGLDAWKLGAASGQPVWHTRFNAGGTDLSDVAQTPSGDLLITGSAPSPTRDPIPVLFAAALDPANGQTQWSVTPQPFGTETGVDVLPADGGGAIVTANGYGGPWWVLRVITPGSDGLFADGFEP